MMKSPNVPSYINPLTLVKKVKEFFQYSHSATPRFFRQFLHAGNGHNYNSRDDLNTHMFREDIALGVMPIGGRSRHHEDFSVKINGADEDVKKAEHLLSSLDSNSRYYGHKKLCCEVVEGIVSELAWKGFSRYEITVDDEGFELKSFTQKRLYNLGVMFLQVAPKEDVKYYRRRVGLGLHKHVWEICMPPTLGGRSGYNKLLQDLQRFSGSAPDFWRVDLHSGVQENTLDLKYYSKKAKIFHWGKSSIWGWSQRDYQLEDCTEFYLINRIIRFNKAQAFLREHIISELNLLLRRLNIQAEIIVEGLPSSSDIAKIIQDTIDGNLPLDKARELSSV